MELLRLMTAGSVDDGKSTLIGRLLHDTGSIWDDQLEALAASRKHESEALNLALLTDGLRAERAQGITIDVAYRFFSTLNRRFVILDAPGHEEYTRNMATAASQADLAIILIDAARGISTQTKRHILVASWFRVPRLIFAMNKMDLVDFSEDRFLELREELRALFPSLGITEAKFLPLCAIDGDNVARPSVRMPWYGSGPTLLSLLEEAPLGASAFLSAPSRFPVQYVIRDGVRRLYAGRIEKGTIRIGDCLRIFPSENIARVSKIYIGMNSLEMAEAPLSISLELDAEFDVARGDLLVGAEASLPRLEKSVELRVVWMGRRDLAVGDRLILTQGYRESKAEVTALNFRVDVDTLGRHSSPQVMQNNDLGHIRVRLAKPMLWESYDTCREAGGVVLLDQVTGHTLGAGMVI